MRRLLFSAILLLLSSTNVWATITVDSISGASRFETIGTTTHVYGGLAGVDKSGDGSGLVDNCPETSATTCLGDVANQPLCACNNGRIYPTLNLGVSVTRSAGATLGTIIAVPTGSTKLAGTNSTTSASFPWSSVCPLVGATSGTTTGLACDQNNTTVGTLVIVVCSDNNNSSACDAGEDQTTLTVHLVNPGADHNVYGNPSEDGMGNFTPYPGDGKIYIDNPQTTGTFPGTSYQSQITAIRVYYSLTSMDEAIPGLATGSKDLRVVDDGNTLAESVVDDLENGKGYFFRIASLDQANNILQYFPGTQNLPADCVAGSANAETCIYAAIPDQVLGMLTKDFNCFVATAAYGTSMEPKLRTFRDFRYKILLRHNWGRQFVFAYYHYGPIAARFIADSPAWRAAARGLLWPLYGFSLLALKTGLWPALICSLLLLAAALTLPWYGWRRLIARD